jgi:hypothetical protein
VHVSFYDVVDVDLGVVADGGPWVRLMTPPSEGSSVLAER